ncbi:MAG: hypothetical protein ACLPKE_13895, partial [Streptosporangiaceae bacterium]
EHPQTPVRSPDDWLIPRPLAHRSPLSWPTTQVCNQPSRPASPSPQMLRRYGASARSARARRTYDRIMQDRP